MLNFLAANLIKIILGIIVLSSLVLVIKNFARIKNFLSEVKTELKKVSWSTRQELAAATLMVILITAILGFFLGIVDFGFSRALRLIIK